jgi:hypothetical protein
LTLQRAVITDLATVAADTFVADFEQ